MQERLRTVSADTHVTDDVLWYLNDGISMTALNECNLGSPWKLSLATQDDCSNSDEAGDRGCTAKRKRGMCCTSAARPIGVQIGRKLVH